LCFVGDEWFIIKREFPMFYSLNMSTIITAAVKGDNVRDMVSCALDTFSEGMDRDMLTQDIINALTSVQDVQTWRAMSDKDATILAIDVLSMWIEGEDDVFCAVQNVLDNKRVWLNLDAAQCDLTGFVINRDPVKMFILEYVKMNLSFARQMILDVKHDMTCEDAQSTLYVNNLDLNRKGLASHLASYALDQIL
jgi:hypothetical protein